MKQYDVATLFEIAFGIKNYALYRPEGVGTPPNPPGFNFSGIKVLEDVQEASRLSYMGTPIVFPIKFRGGNYNTYKVTGEIERFPIEDFELPAATLVNFRRAKILSTTNALANSGTVKEMYGFDDWTVDIRGLCLRDPGHPTAKTAYEQHEKLLDFEKIADSVVVVGDLFASKNIHHLVIKEIDFKQVQGKPGVIPFYLRCVSDSSTELIGAL
ncbi:DUF6046 domain-containing protein [Allomuricauda sp. M10]|uniref:DUF6046 domain-containing protein n=1 Tax=Allomuricauda sp. M10 TaxID=2683292 RepID=UPI001D1820A9|nr:DUF6046 domain-containing protein [Muricauda sp. M10]